jgi:hypothetical protein
MLTHPDLLMAELRFRERELIAEADRRRRLAFARHPQRPPTGGRGGRNRTAAGVRPDGTLAACEPRVAAPAR